MRSLYQTFLLLGTLLWPIFCLGSQTLSPDTNFNVGFTRMQTQDPMGGSLRYSVWYPTTEPAQSVDIGPFSFAASRNALLASGNFGLVVISHGSGGSDLGHRSIAIKLAQVGIIAVAPLHPRNNFRDNSGIGRRVVWEGRPKQIAAVINAIKTSKQFSDSIAPQKIGLFGFSIGGYTMLSALGARADLTYFIKHCERNHQLDPVCTAEGDVRVGLKAIVETEYQTATDPFSLDTVCSAVLADPLAALFDKQALASLKDIPLKIYLPEIGNALSPQFNGQFVIDTLVQSGRTNVEFQFVKGAQHYSFITPFPASIARTLPDIANDQQGFDRAAFHDTFSEEIAEYFLKTFSDCG